MNFTRWPRWILRSSKLIVTIECCACTTTPRSLAGTSEPVPVLKIKADQITGDVSPTFYAKTANGFSGPLMLAIVSADGKTVYAHAEVAGLTGD